MPPPAAPRSAPRRTLGYARVSGADQDKHGTSLDGQRDTFVAHCARNSWPAPDIRVEVESASEENIESRVELARLIADAQPGDVVLVSKLDRWSRDIVFGVQSIRALVKRGVGFYSIDEGIDAATPHGDEQLGIRMWVAECERRRIRDRTVGRSEALRAQGLWSAPTVPYGYRRGDRAQRRQLFLELHEDEAKIVREMYERCAETGASIRDLRLWLAEIPGAPRHAATIHRSLRGRIYLGEMKSAGAWIKGQHPAIVDRDLWERAMASMRGRVTYGRNAIGARTADLLLRGILRCGLCGSRVGVTFAPKGERYYVCARRRHPADRGDCASPYLRTDRADPAATAALLARISELRAELLAAPTAPDSAGALPAREEDFAAVRTRLAQRLSRAVALAVDGAITGPELAAQRHRVDVELGALAVREGAALRAVAAARPEARASVADAMAGLARAWAGLAVEERRTAVGLLAARVVVGSTGELTWTWWTAAEMMGRK